MSNIGQYPIMFGYQKHPSQSYRGFLWKVVVKTEMWYLLWNQSINGNDSSPGEGGYVPGGGMLPGMGGVPGGRGVGGVNPPKKRDTSY